MSEFAKTVGSNDDCIQIGGITFTIPVSAKAVADDINAKLDSEKANLTESEEVELRDAEERLKRPEAGYTYSTVKALRDIIRRLIGKPE